MKVSILLAIHLIAILIIQSVACENMLGLKEYWLWEGFFLHLSLLSIFSYCYFTKQISIHQHPYPKTLQNLLTSWQTCRNFVSIVITMIKS